MWTLLVVLILVLAFTGVGTVVAPALAPLLVVFAVLDIIMLAVVAGATVVSAIKERLEGL